MLRLRLQKIGSLLGLLAILMSTLAPTVSQALAAHDRLGQAQQPGRAEQQVLAFIGIPLAGLRLLRRACPRAGAAGHARGVCRHAIGCASTGRRNA
jgi:hypothetical protein